MNNDTETQAHTEDEIIKQPTFRLFPPPSLQNQKDSKQRERSSKQTEKNDKKPTTQEQNQQTSKKLKKTKQKTKQKNSGKETIQLKDK